MSHLINIDTLGVSRLTLVFLVTELRHCQHYPQHCQPTPKVAGQSILTAVEYAERVILTDESPNWLNNIVITTDGQLNPGGEMTN